MFLDLYNEFLNLCIEVSFLSPILDVFHNWIVSGTNDFLNNSLRSYHYSLFD